MKKHEFLEQLKNGLSGLPAAEVQRTLEDFSEAIADRMEEGLSEQEAVAALGDPEELVNQILQTSEAGAKAPKVRRKLSGWEIALLILGFPLWLPLLATAGALVLVALVVLWVLVLVLYVVDLTFAVCGPTLLVFSCYYLCRGHFPEGLLCIGCGLLLTGLALALFLGCNGCAKGAWWLSKHMVLGIGRSIIKRR